MSADQNSFDGKVTITWMPPTNLPEGELRQYIIELKKRLTTRTEETPITYTSLDTSVQFEHLPVSTSYEARVRVETFNFGLSDFTSSPVIFKTPDISTANTNAITELQEALVRVYTGYNVVCSHKFTCFLNFRQLIRMTLHSLQLE